MRYWASRTSHALVLALCLSLLVPAVGRAQEAHVLRLNGPGSATVILSASQRLAFLVDGGNKGVRGLAAAEIDGRPVLEYLRDRGVTHLVLVCSHPDADHMGGVVEVSRDLDRLSYFDKVTFIDSGFRSGTEMGSRRLIEHHRESVASATKAGRTPKLPVAVGEEAENRNAFKGLISEDADLAVENYVYSPAPIAGKEAHGHAIIVEYTLRRRGASTKAVDFDDASPGLIAQWIADSRSADYVLLPHHGSDKEKLEAIFRAGARGCIISANPRNQYRHPGPTTLERAIAHYGLENVHITGLGSVRITPDGVVPNGDAKQRMFSEIVAPQRVYVEREFRANEEALHSAAAIGDRDQVKRRERRIAELLAMWATTRRLEIVLTGNDPGDPPEVRGGGGGGGNNDGGGGTGRGNGGGGTARGNGAGEGDGGGNGGSGGGGVWPQQNTGRWRQVLGQRGTTPSLANRRSLFDENLRGFPQFGGIVLGNSVHSDLKIKRATIEVMEPSEGSAPESENGCRLLLETDKGTLSYDDMTPSELVRAIHFVASGEVGIIDGGVASEVQVLDSGAVASVGDWVFGINPTVADTLVAWDAVHLDAFVSECSRQTRSGLWVLDLGRGHQASLGQPDWDTYVWYDAESRLDVVSGRVVVVSMSEPRDALLRVRLVGSEGQTLTELSSGVNSHLPNLRLAFDSYRRLEAFSRLVAVLRAVQDATGAVPTVPPQCRSQRFPVPAIMDARSLGYGMPPWSPASDVEPKRRPTKNTGSRTRDWGVIAAIAIGVLLACALIGFWRRRAEARKRKPRSDSVDRAGSSDRAGADAATPEVPSLLALVEGGPLLAKLPNGGALKVTIAKHSYYRLEEGALCFDLPVTQVEEREGAEVTIRRGPDGRLLNVRVPPGSAGRQLRFERDYPCKVFARIVVKDDAAELRDAILL